METAEIAVIAAGSLLGAIFIAALCSCIGCCACVLGCPCRVCGACRRG